MKRSVYVFIACLVASLPHAPRPAESQAKRLRTVAILVFDGVELLDFAGPAEVFIVARNGSAYRVFTVAEAKGPVRTMGGLTLQPDYSIDDAPQPDILVVPGGGTANVSRRGVQWVKTTAGKAKIAMSVCMGAFLFARAGLLDGLKATTHHWGLDSLQSASPTCKVVRDRRFVDTGKIITTAGVSAGSDGALQIVERLDGRKAANWVAEEWMEYRRMGAAKSDRESPKPTKD